MSELFPLFTTGCDGCSLKQEWPKLKYSCIPIIPPSEQTPYRVLCLGEAPDSAESEQGIPFVGKTGQYLRQSIPPDWKTKFYVGSICRCQPSGNREPTDREIYSCTTGFLEPDLVKLKPHAILAIGDIALSYFFPERLISRMRGITCTVQLADGTPTWFSSTFHPSYVLRAEREVKEVNSEAYRSVNVVAPLFKSDLKKFFAKIPKFAERPPKLYNPPKGKILYPKSKQEALALFARLKEPFGFDIETSKLEPYVRDAAIVSAAFSDGDLTFAFPVDWPGMLIKWGISAFDDIMHSNRVWIAHNAAFELAWVWHTTKYHRQNYHDTMVLERLIQQRSKKQMLRLEDGTLFHLGIDVKTLSKVDSSRLLDFPLNEVLEYNAYDAWGCHQLYQYQMEFGGLTEKDKANYQRTLRTIKSVVAMELEGLEVNIEESEKLDKALREQERQLDDNAKALKEVKQYERDTGKVFSLSSPRIVAQVLSRYCHIDLPETAKGNVTTADDALDHLVDAHPLVRLVLDSRDVKTQLTRYVTPILTGKALGADFKVHAQYTVVFTSTFRLSCQGYNLQNVPKRKHREIRKMIVPPPGYVIASFDYGQLEARVLVMASNDNVLRQQFINDEDIHSKWLHKVIKAYPPYFDRLREKTNQTEEKKILKAGRDIIKTDFVFASFYGSVARSISDRAMIPLHIAEDLLEEFWSEYRIVKKWQEGQFRQYQSTGTVQSLTGRIRNDVLKGNEPINSPIQGTGSEIVLEAQTALMDMGLEKDFMFLPRINVHDSLDFLIKDDENLGNYIETIAKEMIKPRFPFITLPLVVEFSVGENWCDLHGIGKMKGEYFEPNYR